MINIARILCPVDFSDFSRHALDHAVGIARWYDARVTALHVLPPIAAFLPPSGDGLYPPIVFSDEDLQQFHAELAAFTRTSPGVPIDTEVTQGSVIGEITRFAAELPADLIVMGTHGRSGFDRFMLGSTTEKLLRKAPCPVLTVPVRSPDAAHGALFTRVLCAVDFSPASLRAVALAESLAGEAAANLCLMHVLEPVSVFEPVVAGGAGALPVSAEVRREARNRLEGLVAHDTRAFAEVVEVVVAGKPYREILRVAAEQRSDLIVIGAHGGRLGLPAFGSTTNQVVRAAECPVLTVRA